MPTFACCAMQSGYALLMLCFKARAFHKYSGVDGSSSTPSAGTGTGTSSLTGFLNELQQSLRLVVKCLANYSIAFEALQGMRGKFCLNCADIKIVDVLTDYPV